MDLLDACTASFGNQGVGPIRTRRPCLSFEACASLSSLPKDHSRTKEIVSQGLCHYPAPKLLSRRLDEVMKDDKWGGAGTSAHG